MDNRGNIRAEDEDAMANEVATLILAQMTEMKDDFREDIRELKNELKNEIKEVKTEITKKDGVNDRLTDLESKVVELMDREPTGAGQSKSTKKSLKESAPVIASSIGGGAGLMALLDYLATLINKAGH